MSDIASPGPIDPNSGQPDHHAEVSAVKAWLRQNAVSLVITAAVVGLVLWKLDPIDTLKVVIGLGLVIFIHELGHFLAAKWCDVHVKTFSIGFGPAVPFCSHKWGETTYMIGIIPLGGYVSMVGEGTGEGVGDTDPEEEENDPRSFKNKSVWSRMIIISAGVIMNVILGMACFVAAYFHGVKEEPAGVGTVFSGSAAWRDGIRSDSLITRIGSREHPVFKDLRPIVMSSLKGEQIAVTVESGGKTETLKVEPLREEGTYFPTLGISSPSRLALAAGTKRTKFPPVVPGSPAANATGPGGEKFQRGDRIVAMSDPDKGGEVTPIPPDPRFPASGPSFAEYWRRMVLLAGKPVTFHVLRADQPDDASPLPITVEPAYRTDLGLRMQMGKVAAVRRGGPADGKVQAVEAGSPPTSPGDRIKAVKLPPGPDRRQAWFVNGPVDWSKPEFKTDDPKLVDVKPLDPVLLPLELNRWSDGNPADRTVRLVVLRQQGHKEDDPVELSLAFDPSYRFDREVLPLANSPLPVPGLGLAYWVNAVVADDPAPGSPAAEPQSVDAGGAKPGPLKSEDQIVAVRLRSLDESGEVKSGEWDEIKGNQWAPVEMALQGRPPYEIDLRVKRGDETLEVRLKGRASKDWPIEDRGLLFQQDYQVHRAGDIGGALDMGWWRTVRFIKDIYMNLYGMIRGRISAKTMSGPLTIANVSYKLAGEDFWQFLLFLGMISVNLAVVNFLPIPVLDGGHMVFLIIEKILGRPVPERLFAIAMYAGLFLILGLMVFVVILDIGRLF